jgi:hypothetical protein
MPGSRVTLLLTFETVSAALDCEGLLKNSGRPCRVIPVPRSLGLAGASCGYAISLETRPPNGEAGGLAVGCADDTGAFCRDLRAGGAGFVKAFRCTEAGGRETYEEVRF